MATQSETSPRPNVDADIAQLDDSKIRPLEELADADRPPNALHQTSTRSDISSDLQPSPSSNPTLHDSLSPDDPEGHSTAVYDLAGWVPPPETEDEDAQELERDIPGGLGFTDESPSPTAGAPSGPLELEASASSNATNRFSKASVTALISGILLAGSVVVLVITGRLGADNFGQRSVLPGASTQAGQGLRGVFPTSMRSFLYPTRFGTEHLVVIGEVESRSDQAESNLDVIVELLDHDNEIVASARAPMGLTLSVEEIASIADRRDLEDLVATKVAETGVKTLPAMGEIPFMVTLVCPPSDVGKLRHRVRLAQSTLVKGSYGLVK